eukprot:TRINITY_DN5032_c2_g1_i1.p1 TRINITY_DN5032_c2_g1~~TRINITY_DN5032_c2_g1_i1.p1  ORF type:complete len:466 (+),score=58.28 TRINITY_DN5032_c2_g1_i1:89-1486(+)
MSDVRDPAIKLFGKTILVPANEESTAAAGDDGGGDGDLLVRGDEDKDTLNQKSSESNEEDQAALISEELNGNPKTPPVDKEPIIPETLKPGEQGENGISQEKTLKKPDKILPCPRCNSLDTKFCYYNNYNVNQPRHFCKKCQRYWTAGGAMRNVPVGAGRRKTKNSALHYRHITASDALQTDRTDTVKTVHHASLNSSGTILRFGSDPPLCESMASVLDLADKTMRNSNGNGFHRSEAKRISVTCGKNNDEHSGGSSNTVSNPTEEENRANQGLRNCQGFPPQITCFPGPPWSYPLNSAQWSSPLAPPAFCASSFPVPFYPTTPYWGCPIPGAWSIPFLPPPQSSPTSNGSSGSGPNSPLGKHSREENTFKQGNSENEEIAKQSNSERCLWIPKTLRIDDPSEAARSSIWSTLGIKRDKAGEINGGLFKAFNSKGEDKNHTAEASQVLHANPAALLRSLNFHEGS